MSYDNVIEEAGDFRVRLVHDDDHEFPDFIQSAVIPMSDRYQSHNDTNGLGAMIRREWSWRLRDAGVIERWLRIFHGVRAVGQVDTRDVTYLVLLTDEAAESYGTPDDRMQECADGDAESFRQWAEGEVYGYVVEKKTHWIKVDSTGTPIQLDDETYREDWEEVDSLWGMFGYEYAEGEAREALTSWVEEAAAA